MAPEKRTKTTATSTSRAPAAQGNSSLPYAINKDNIVFMDADHASRYDFIVTRKLSTPSYFDWKILDTVSLYDDLRMFFGYIGVAELCRISRTRV